MASGANLKHYPSPGSYAVAQIDLEATLSKINDQGIRSAALKIQTTKCLVLLNMVRVHTISSILGRAKTSYLLAACVP